MLSIEDEERYLELLREARKRPHKMNRKHFLNNDYHSGASFRAYLKIANDGEVNGCVTITDCYKHVNLEIDCNTKKALNRTIKKYKTLVDDLETLVDNLEELRPYVEEMEKLQRKATRDW